jgi:hypothetical protein
MLVEPRLDEWEFAHWGAEDTVGSGTRIRTADQ